MAMVNQNNDDCSSSDDEVSKAALKEATDHQFFNSTCFSNAKSEVSNISEKSSENNRLPHNNAISAAVSLRKNLEQVDKFSNFGVSASFQTYVAKKLDEIIEKSIRVKKAHGNNVTKKTETLDDSFGVKLFSSSIGFLTAKEEEKTKKVKASSKKKRKIEAAVDSKTNLLKCKEVAVDPEWILSKKETKAWTSKRKEPEFKYKKLKNGTLVEAT